MKTFYRLTRSLRQAVHFLSVSVGFIPDERERESRRRRKLLLERSSLHGHHQMHFSEAEGNDRLRHDHLQDGFVREGPGAEIHQVQIAAGNGRLLVENLENHHACFK